MGGYKFQVIITEMCPKNQTEWSERSSKLNCTIDNAYMCFPNENFTELLEFCYMDRRIRIEEGMVFLDGVFL